MTRIDFYHFAEDRLRVACRLASKAHEHSKRVIAWSPDRKVLADFDRLLWTFQSLRFVPHCLEESPLAADTPVLLCHGRGDPPHHEVLINLSDEEPPFFPSFERLLEIVASDEPSRHRGGERLAAYEKRGYEVHVNAIEGS